jgi:hypothetical protein
MGNDFREREGGAPPRRTQVGVGRGADYFGRDVG